MAKTSIFLPVATEYDPSLPSLEEIFDVSAQDKLDFFKALYARYQDKDIPAARAFFEMLQEKVIPEKMLLFLATFGATSFLEEYDLGLGLYYFAEKGDDK